MQDRGHPESRHHEPVKAASPSRAVATAIVADDDVALRRSIVERLIEDGYDVYEAPSGIEVLHILTSRSAKAPRLEQVGLLVTDHRMPGLTGLEVIRSLRARRFNSPCILMSAFPDAWLRGQADDLSATILQKPFSLAVLSEVARAMVLPNAPSERLARSG